jgi:hypothetical protein
MSATPDDLARRIAARLMPTTDRGLRDRVEQVLRAQEEQEPGTRGLDPAHVLALEQIIVAIVALAWSAYTSERDRMERKAAEARSAEQKMEVDALRAEVAYIRGRLDAEVRAEGRLPRATPENLRIAVVEAMAEEAVEPVRRERIR